MFPIYNQYDERDEANFTKQINVYSMQMFYNIFVVSLYLLEAIYIDIVGTILEFGRGVFQHETQNKSKNSLSAVSGTILISI